MHKLSQNIRFFLNFLNISNSNLYLDILTFRKNLWYTLNRSLRPFVLRTLSGGSPPPARGRGACPFMGTPPLFLFFISFLSINFPFEHFQNFKKETTQIIKNIF